MGSLMGLLGGWPVAISWWTLSSPISTHVTSLQLAATAYQLERHGSGAWMMTPKVGLHTETN
jgi:hypothetical protein